MTINNLVSNPLRKLLGIELPNNLYCTQSQDGSFHIISLVGQSKTNCQYDVLRFLVLGTNHLLSNLQYYYNPQNKSYISQDSKYGKTVRPLDDVLDSIGVIDKPLIYTRKSIAELGKRINEAY